MLCIERNLTFEKSVLYPKEKQALKKLDNVRKDHENRLEALQQAQVLMFSFYNAFQNMTISAGITLRSFFCFVS